MMQLVATVLSIVASVLTIMLRLAEMSSRRTRH
jgi:hypothetical protein